MLCLFAISLPAMATGEYRLGAGDVVKISVYDHEDLQAELQLTQGGDVTFPLVGRVKIAGLTFSEAEKLISGKLIDGGYLKQAFVNVLISQYHSQRISVIGEVNHPGRFELDSATHLVEAIALAGGVAPTGGDKVILVRGDTRTEIALSQFAKPASGDDTLQLRNGDVVMVPRSPQIYVYGEVNRPGAFRLENGMTVVQAIAAAGGFNPRASKRSIELERRQPDGRNVTLDVRLNDAVQDNDVINVQESLF
jgi:polysaccharide export outer membrane protein